MTSGSTREFMALHAIARHFGRPGTPTDQAWIESFNGHLKTEHPHLLAIRNPQTLRAELTLVRRHYNTVRLHSGTALHTPASVHLRHHRRRPAATPGGDPARGLRGEPPPDSVTADPSPRRSPWTGPCARP
jgi:transposase InsO family protein